jgi:hypothetical protein
MTMAQADTVNGMNRPRVVSLEQRTRGLKEDIRQDPFNEVKVASTYTGRGMEKGNKPEQKIFGLLMWDRL